MFPAEKREQKLDKYSQQRVAIEKVQVICQVKCISN